MLWKRLPVRFHQLEIKTCSTKCLRVILSKGPWNVIHNINIDAGVLYSKKAFNSHTIGVACPVWLMSWDWCYGSMGKNMEIKKAKGRSFDLQILLVQPVSVGPLIPLAIFLIDIYLSADKFPINYCEWWLDNEVEQYRSRHIPSAGIMLESMPHPFAPCGW